MFYPRRIAAFDFRVCPREVCVSPRLLRSNNSDPCIPRPKRCRLAVSSIDPRGGVANALSLPPGKYGRKAKTQRNRRGLAQAVEHVVQFDNERRTLPGLEMLVESLPKGKPSLKDREH